MDVPRLRVERDQAPVGSTADFFNESMRRDAISGTRITAVLDKQGFTPIVSTYPQRRNWNLQPGKGLNGTLDICTR